ncbi:helix-turn-helix domain-containing protein [Sphingomonas sp. DG1-23]|uniref:helix-turn-helix domain-containing protein n=1 Tax=Sphingomonas sp. DG1-23 TaxID=3068316 RepID=UPI00273F50F4|nr:helix-turn-helix domain-containing protein [Sphingomonas sp. DG1-23]MDP5281409.1 helix-turn-helix domain-containing protein [Sphingomonas sp. DG1-23]
MSVSDACRHIGIGRTKLYQLISSNSLDVVKIGRRTLILTASIERLINAGGQ